MKFHNRRPLHRRTFLRGVLGGTALAMGLPPLEAFFNASGTAYAASGAFPRRFGLFFWGNGTLPLQWVPEKTGTDYELSDQLSPLASVQKDVAIITGMEVKVANNSAHFSGPAGFLSGALDITSGDDTTFAGPSIDQLIASAIGGETPYRSLEVGVQPGVAGMSFNGMDSVNPPEWEPEKLFARLFGPHFAAPGEELILDPKLSLRRSVLDSVLQDAKALKARLGATDQARLDQHMEAVRDLELRLKRLEEEPPNLAACARPGEPASLPDIDGRPQMSARARLMADLTTMAYACDLTRVSSFWYSHPVNNVLYPDKADGHHNLTHDEPGEQPQVNEIVKGIMGDFAYLVESLRNVEEGDGTLLSNAALLATSDVSLGRTHAITEFPIVLAGTCCGALKTGFHYRSETAENASHVQLSLLQAMGVNTSEFGKDNARVTSGLSALNP